jgi:hypothetical protein
MVLHMHPSWLLLILFVAGQSVYILKQAAFAIRNPANPTESRRDFLYRNWDTILIRIAVEQCLFWSWVSYPEGLNKLMSLIHITADITLPKEPVVAFAFGMASDVVLDWLSQKIPGLRSQLPAVNGSAH